MSSPAGPCEWCGGPQVWTVIGGEVYVSCEGGCLPLPLEGLAPLSGGEIVVKATIAQIVERLTEWRVSAREGADAKTSDGEKCQGIPDGDALPF